MIIKLIISILICELAGIAGAFSTANSIKTWYAQLNKPALNPPSWIFGPVWTLLYLLMGISLYLVWSKSGSMPISYALILFAIQLILNAIWSPLFFCLHSPFWAFIDLLLMWFSILATILAFYPINQTAALLLLPYITWVTFAGYLNYSIWRLN